MTTNINEADILNGLMLYICSKIDQIENIIPNIKTLNFIELRILNLYNEYIISSLNTIIEEFRLEADMKIDYLTTSHITLSNIMLIRCVRKVNNFINRLSYYNCYLYPYQYEYKVKKRIKYNDIYYYKYTCVDKILKIAKINKNDEIFLKDLKDFMELVGNKYYFINNVDTVNYSYKDALISKYVDGVYKILDNFKLNLDLDSEKHNIKSIKKYHIRVKIIQDITLIASFIVMIHDKTNIGKDIKANININDRLTNLGNNLIKRLNEIFIDEL